MENPNKFFGHLNIRKQGKEGKKLGRAREREVEREDTFSKFAAKEEEKASETFHETYKNTNIHKNQDNFNSRQRDIQGYSTQ